MIALADEVINNLTHARHLLRCMSRLVARSGRAGTQQRCLLLGQNRTHMFVESLRAVFGSILPIAALVTDLAIEAWYHPLIA
jgi:hypothetical protein